MQSGIVSITSGREYLPRLCVHQLVANIGSPLVLDGSCSSKMPWHYDDWYVRAMIGSADIWNVSQGDHQGGNGPFTYVLPSDFRPTSFGFRPSLNLTSWLNTCDVSWRFPALLWRCSAGKICPQCDRQTYKQLAHSVEVPSCKRCLQDTHTYTQNNTVITLPTNAVLAGTYWLEQL